MVIALAVDLLVVVALAGLFVRRRSSVCYSFTAQLAFILVTDLLMIFGGARFYTREFWMFKEGLSHFLTFAIALEVTYRTFRAFPGARATARTVLIVVLCLTTLWALSASQKAQAGPESEVFLIFLKRVYPGLLNGAIWLFTAVAALILWYRLPVDAFLKAILVAEVPYMLIYWVSLNAVEAYGVPVVRKYISYSDPIAYMLLIAYWAYAAWRPFRAPVRADPSPAHARLHRIA
jgi:hypothetical protein